MAKKAITLLSLLLTLWAPLALAQGRNITFAGKIKEIGKKTKLGVLDRDTFLIIKLENYPNTEFHISPDDAAKFGIIESAASSPVLPPGKLKGLGWKVRLTCDNKGSLKFPIYHVTSLERLND